MVSDCSAMTRSSLLTVITIHLLECFIYKKNDITRSVLGWKKIKKHHVATENFNHIMTNNCVPHMF
jgi:hypothetical protein